MKNGGIRLSLYINYFIFAILLNSVGIVILKSINVYQVSETSASVLEAFKDLPIAIVSFMVASFLPRIGYKKSMLIALIIVMLGCVMMIFGNSFNAAKILFAMVGVAFALIKVSVYSVIGLITKDKNEHNSLMSSVEGVFMFGIALAYFLFPAFNSEANQDAWLNVYWLLSGLCLLSFLFLLFSPFDEGNEIPGANLGDDFKQMFALITKLLVIVFLIGAFLFVMMEQGIMTWLPTFNNKVLNLPENASVMMASILAISLGAGRLLAGALAKKVSWFWITLVSIIISMLLVTFLLPQAMNANVGPIQSFSDIPFIGYAFPLIGLFLGPIYPLLNSAILSALPKRLHSPMTGLIIIFSALGGTLGSRVIGWLFEHVGGEKAFFYTLIPMGLLILVLVILNKLTSTKKEVIEVV